jgi:hypothetical protein
MHTGCMLGYSWSHNIKTEDEELYYNFASTRGFLGTSQQALAKKLYSQVYNGFSWYPFRIKPWP